MDTASISRKASWAPLLLAVSVTLFMIFTTWPASGRITHGFAAYYVSSRLLLEGRADQVLYDDALFRAEVERETSGQAGDIYWANPPTTALMFLPLAPFPPASARRLWTGLSLIALAGAIAVSARALSPAPLRTPAFYLTTSAFILSAPLASNLEFGQAYVLILALMCLALFALRRRLDWLVGMCLALAMALKASGIPLWALLALHGRWRPLAWSGLIFAAFILAALPLTGVALWQKFLFQVVPAFLQDPAVAATAYQTVPGFFRHLFAYDPIWNPAPPLNWPFAGVTIAALVSISLLAFAGWRARRASPQWTFCTGLLLSVILVPAAEQHHYVLLFPAFLLAVCDPSTPRWSLLLAAALIALPSTYVSTDLSHGWWSLLAYPRLYGAILLFIVLQLYHEIPREIGAGRRENPS